MANRDNTLAKASKDLMLKEPFYGLILMMLNKLWTEKIPTAGVSRNGINFQLALNENFWENLTPNHQKGLLKHELLHIFFFHLTDFQHLSNKKVANIAMDLEINQYIDRNWLPEGGMVLELFPELNLESLKGTNYYYKKLLEASKDKSCPALNKLLEEGPGQSIQIEGGGSATAPDHSSWGEFDNLDDATKGLLKKQAEHVLKNAAEQTVKGRGTVPSEFQEILENINNVEPPKFNWKGYLRKFAGGSTKIYTKKTRRKYNKRYEDNPGLKIKPKRHILVAIDTSGSVSTDELKEFMHEINHIHKSGSEVTILQADTAISNIAPFKKSSEFIIHGRGGTDFQPAIDYYRENNHKYTCLVYFTDGEAPSPENARGRMLWVLSSNSQENEDLPGFVIKLN